MPNPLSGPSFRYVIRELDQVGVAVSLTGTKKVKLQRLAKMVEPMVDSMVGSRPEVRRIRDELNRRVFNMRRSSPEALKASKAIRRVLETVRDLQKLVDQRGMADVPEMFFVEEFDLENVWGYSDNEIRATLIALRRASKATRDAGMRASQDSLVILDPVATQKLSQGTYVGYDPRRRLFMADIGKALSGDMGGILGALGARVWFETLKADDREVWGKDPERFSESFARKLATNSVDADTSARLMVSVGKYARRWPEAA